MENRWSDRRDLQLGVDVYRAGDKIMSCLSKNIGLGGTFLAADTNHELERDADVELVFHLDDGTKQTKYFIHAKVVRLSDDGVGFKFHDFDTSVFRSLQELINYKGKQAIH